MKKLIAAAAALASSAFAADAQRPVAYADNPDLIGQHHTSGHLLIQVNPTNAAGSPSPTLVSP